MKILLTLLLSAVPLTSFAQVQDWSSLVDPWKKECNDSGCNLTLIKNVRGAKAHSDWFALGLSVSSAATPDYFVFSFPPTPTTSQVVLSFVTLEKQATGMKPVVREVASFNTQPCALRKDCKIRFAAAIVPAREAGSFQEVNVWQALQTRNLLDVQQTFVLNGARVERGMSVALPAFQKVVGEWFAK